jgi:hypothetical protein
VAARPPGAGQDSFRERGDHGCVSTVRPARWRPPAWTSTLLLAGLWLFAGPLTPDLAAQAHRVGMFAAHGFVVWDNTWYGGHHVPGYSLVFPAVAAVAGARFTGAVAAVLSAALFESLFARSARAACWWFAVGCTADLLVGRLTYALGVTAGLAALAALMRGPAAAAVALSVVCAATSPVAGLFLALAAVVVVLNQRRRDALALAAAALVTVGVMSVAFPEGGTQPFSSRAFAVTLGMCVLVAAVLDRRTRVAVAAYGAAVVACFAVASPMGANIERLGTALAGPLVLLGARQVPIGRRGALAATLIAVAAWQWLDPITQAARGWDDASSAHAAYYRPLLARLHGLDVGSGRVEVPFTQGHWESVYLARRVPLARGWERQLDRALNPLFYRGRLSPAAYDRWLRSNAVRYVALPDAPMDPAGLAEATLVASAPPFLQPVWRGRHWRLFGVRDPVPLAAGGTHVRLGTTTVRLDAARPGRMLVRVHWTRYWQVAGGSGCVTRDGRWTLLDARRAGRFVLAARFSIGRLLRAHACSPHVLGRGR